MQAALTVTIAVIAFMCPGDGSDHLSVRASVLDTFAARASVSVFPGLCPAGDGPGASSRINNLRWVGGPKRCLGAGDGGSDLRRNAPGTCGRRPLRTPSRGSAACGSLNARPALFEEALRHRGEVPTPARLVQRNSRQGRRRSQEFCARSSDDPPLDFLRAFYGQQTRSVSTTAKLSKLHRPP